MQESLLNNVAHWKVNQVIERSEIVYLERVSVRGRERVYVRECEREGERGKEREREGERGRERVRE